MAEYDDFEDSFESSSESDTDKQPYETKEDKWDQSYEQCETIQHVKSAQCELELSSEIALQYKFGRTNSPKSSPLSRKKFRPHFKKPHGLGNITQKIKKKKKKIFGVNLQTAVYRSELGADGIELPTVFRQCIDYLEENALEHEGLYRLAGVKSQIEGVKAIYDKDTYVDLSDYDPNTVASLLKLYLRELPEPLISTRLLPKFEAATHMDTAEMQLAILNLLMDELPLCNRLLLGWLLNHMSHIAEKADINKMGISNLIIVFSPTLQLPIPIMHLLYDHRDNLFPDVEIKKYSRPQKDSNTFDLPDPNSLETEEEVTAELTRLSDILEKLHTKVHSSEGKYDERDDYCWELQRVVTELRRRKKLYEQLSASKLGDEQEFMKTLILMTATLQAENEELKDIGTTLKDLIRKEAEQIESYKRELRLYESRENHQSEEELTVEESVMSQTLSKLLWQKRELQLQHSDLLNKIQSEEDAIFRLTVQLRVAPLETQLQGTH